MLYQRLAFFELGAELALHCVKILEALDIGSKEDFKKLCEEFGAESKRLRPMVDAILVRTEKVLVDNEGNERKLLFREHFNRVIQMQHNVRLDGMFTVFYLNKRQ